MARVTVEDWPPGIVENRLLPLCLLTVKRARQLTSGARPIAEATKDKSTRPVAP